MKNPQADLDMYGRPMMPISLFRELLGGYADEFTDEQLVPMRADIYRIADAIFDRWMRERFEKRNIDSPTVGAAV